MKTAVVDSPAGQYSSISANITEGFLSPSGDSFVILSIF
jgi:hypothetical protein